MTEKHKMLNQEYYLSWDPELVAEREIAKDILFEFNQLRPSKRDARHQIIRRLFGRIGQNPWIESPFNCDYGYNIFAGDNLYINANCTILDCAEIRLGDQVLIGPNVSFYTPNHALDSAERRAGYERARPICIGDNVWIGGSVTILPGVTIGHNSVIGAGSLVTHDIPANVIAVGAPCKVLRAISLEDRLGLKLD